MIPESEKWGYWEGLLFVVVVYFLLALEGRLGREKWMIEADLDVIYTWIEAEIWSSAAALVSVQSLSSLSLLQHLRSIYRIIPLLPWLACWDPGGGWGLLWNCLYEGLENSAVHSLRELLLDFSAYNSKDHASFLPRKSFKYYVF